MPQELSSRYLLLEQIGEGGMARVYKAEDRLLGRVVAVKILREQYTGDPAFLARFQQEAKAAAKLAHPNIVSIYDLEQEGSLHFIVMEYVEGHNLKEIILRDAPFPVEYALEVAQQICAGLDYAHSHGVIHRDIKPQNIMVVPARKGVEERPSAARRLLPPTVKITDFGIARALGQASFSASGEVLGSVHYFSPEQARGETATQVSDVYSVGIVLFEMLTGKLPFSGESAVAVALKQIQDSPPSLVALNPRVPAGLAGIVLRAIAKGPADRFPSAGELGETLRRYSELASEHTGVFSRTVVPPSPARVSGGPAGAVALGGSTSQTRRPSPAPVRRPPPPGQTRRGGVDWPFVLVMLVLVVLLFGLFALGAAAYRAYSAAPAAVPTAEPAATVISEVVVPGVERLVASQARELIEKLGLRYEEAGQEFSPDVVPGTVIRQIPAKGTRLPPDSVVYVMISKGADKISVPWVLGFKYEDAEKSLIAAGLTVQRLDAWNGQMAKDVVFNQNPPAGTTVTAKSTVVLEVSKGRDKATVPDVFGKKEDEAKKLIQDAGLMNFPWVNYQSRQDVPWVSQEIWNKICVGCVISSDPTGGAEVERGAEVKIAVRKDDNPPKPTATPKPTPTPDRRGRGRD